LGAQKNHHTVHEYLNKVVFHVGSIAAAAAAMVVMETLHSLPRTSMKYAVYTKIWLAVNRLEVSI
jgi:hypothetical protein